MRVIHRGLTIEMEDDDPRVAIFEAVLFGRALPPPQPPPVTQTTLPQPWQTFWASLPVRQRRELELLTQRAWPAAELEKALGIDHALLRAQHARIHRAARHYGVGLKVLAYGRVRAKRRYELSVEATHFIKRLLGGPEATPPRGA